MPNEQIDTAEIERLQRFVASCRAQPPRPIPDCVPLRLNLDDLDKSHANLGDIVAILNALEATTKERDEFERMGLQLCQAHGEALKERDAALMALRSCSTVIMEWGHGLEEAQEIADRIIAAHADLKSENTALKVQVDALMQTIEENEDAHD